jgi:hypothetical protein
LRGAKPAVATFVPHTWPYEPLAVLPPLVQWTDKGMLADPHVSWKIGLPDARVVHATDDVLQVEDEVSAYQLKIIGRGDFNGDGFEDLAVLGSARAKQGAYGQTYYLILTRCRPQGILQLVTNNGRPFLLDGARCP